jgi:hypothetical protein
MFKWNPFVIGGSAPGEVRYVSFGGSGSKSKSVPVQLPAWSPQQQAIASTLGSTIQRGLTEPVPAYPGRLYVPRLPEEEAYLSRTPALAEQVAAMRARLGQPAYAITPETTEQYYQQAIRAPALREWQEVVEPTIREAYAGPGYWGSARAQAQTKGAEELATELGRQRATLYYQDELARRQAAEAAAQREATYGVPYATAEAELMGTAGQYARMIEEQKALADLQRWLMGETVEGVTPYQYSPFLQLAFQYLGLSPYAYGQKTESKSFGGEFGIKW